MTLLWRMQIPPLLQEGKDPAWRNLQQDLQLMHRKDASALQGPRLHACLLLANVAALLLRRACPLPLDSRPGCGHTSHTAHCREVQGEKNGHVLHFSYCMNTPGSDKDAVHRPGVRRMLQPLCRNRR